LTAENFQHNLHLADQVAASAGRTGATPAQVALAWLLAQGDDIAPIPGTRHVARLEENAAADAVHLSDEQLDQLSSLPPAAGDTHTEAQMRMMER
jgi:aryl-alcohol dehydrogenase-like predicted oxidoreductase